ncbi:MAG TPA: type II secretion system protein [Deltaproteobacteria bacterium]|nr:type II secretion system protein [Deltaproteobacteria bacterium]
MRKKLRSQKGFTLIELIVAVGIMLILAAVATPLLLGHIKDSKVSNVNEQLLNVKSAFDSYFTKNNGLISDSDSDGDFLDEMIDAGWISNDPSRHNLTWTVKSYTDSGKTAYFVHITNNPDGSTPDSDGYSYLAAINDDVDKIVDGGDAADGTAGAYQFAVKDTDSDTEDDTLNACFLLYQDSGMTAWHGSGDNTDCG